MKFSPELASLADCVITWGDESFLAHSQILASRQANCYMSCCNYCGQYPCFVVPVRIRVIVVSKGQDYKRSHPNAGRSYLLT